MAPLPVIEVTDFERPSLLACVPGNWCTQPFRIRINLAGSGWYGGDDTRVYVESPSGDRWNQTYASVTVDGTSVEFSFSRLFYPAAGSRIVLVYHPWGAYSAQDTSSAYLPFDQAGAELTLTASPALVDSAGTEVTFTASADGASVLHVVSWEWMAADTTMASGTAACAAGENPCVARVYETGAMMVTARVDGQLKTATAAVSVSESGDFRVDVDCGPLPVIRAAAKVTCRATVYPRWINPMDVQFHWTFTGGAVRVFPHPAAWSFHPGAPVVSSGHGKVEWIGRVVHHGQVDLTAITEAARDTAVATATLAPVLRRLEDRFAALPVTYDSSERPWRTDSTLSLVFLPLAANVPYVDGEPLISGAAVYDLIDDGGPNHGYYYVSDVTVHAARALLIRTWITGSDTPMFRYEDCRPGELLTNRELLRSMRTSKNCKTPLVPDWDALRLGLHAHEGYGAAGRKGHQGQFELVATSQAACGRVPEMLEQLVGRDLSYLERIERLAVTQAMISMHNANLHQYVFGNFASAPFYDTVSTVSFVSSNTSPIRIDDLAYYEPPIQHNPVYQCSSIH